MNWSFSRNPNHQLSTTWKDEYWPCKEWYDLTEHATEKIELFWHWDDLRRAKKTTRMLTEEQFLLWAVNNIVGQICNGGFTQALYNSYGELAEEAVLGLRKFELDPFAYIVEQAWDVFGLRPIPRDCDERIARLEMLSELDNDVSQSESFIAHYGAVKRGSSERFDELESEFFQRLNSDPHDAGYNAAYYRPLSEWIHRHRERFFVDEKTKPWYRF